MLSHKFSLWVCRILIMSLYCFELYNVRILWGLPLKVDSSLLFTQVGRAQKDHCWVVFRLEFSGPYIQCDCINSIIIKDFQSRIIFPFLARRHIYSRPQLNLCNVGLSDSLTDMPPFSSLGLCGAYIYPLAVTSSAVLNLLKFRPQANKNYPVFPGQMLFPGLAHTYRIAFSF